MTKINNLESRLRKKPKKWLVTGVAGFIGSNILETLLKLGQVVSGIDNFATGNRENLEDVKEEVGGANWDRFNFIQGDIRNIQDCINACNGVDYVLHQAALGSVPRSIDDPITTNQANIDGFLNMLVAARDTGTRRFVYAASSSTYGDHPDLPKKEDRIGRPLSPYAVTKYVNELYADVFYRIYGIETIGLRYFNVFGKRQDPAGSYAAVIPKWIGIILGGKEPIIYGDGETSRDFCYIDNAVQANLLAAMSENGKAINKVYNIAYGERTTLKQLFDMIKQNLVLYKPEVSDIMAKHDQFRKGDVKHSLADISLARELLGYEPKYSVVQGMKDTVPWYIER